MCAVSLCWFTAVSFPLGSRTLLQSLAMCLCVLEYSFLSSVFWNPGCRLSAHCPLRKFDLETFGAEELEDPFFVSL